jgi:hypothetical protein
LVLVPLVAFPQSSEEILVTHGPSNDYKAQYEYLRKTTPKQFAILVVEVVGPSQCFVPKGPTDSGGTEYCNTEVILIDTIVIHWLSRDPKSPDDRFFIHYWYSKDHKPKMFSEGQRLIVFLAPSHFQDVHVCSVVAPATEKSLKQVREILWDVL